MIADLDFYALGFDGTPHVGELFAIVLYYVKDWHVHNILISVAHVDKAPNAERLSELLLNELQAYGHAMLPLFCSSLITRSVISSKVIGVSKDSVSLNHSVLDQNPGMWRKVAVMDCMSHVIDRIGDCLDAIEVREMISAFVQLISHSSNVRSLVEGCLLISAGQDGMALPDGQELPDA